MEIDQWMSLRLGNILCYMPWLKLKHLCIVLKRCLTLEHEYSSLVEHWTPVQKVAALIPNRSGGKFSSPRLTFCADLFQYSLLPHVTAVARKRLQSFCRRLHLNMHTPLTWQSQSRLTMLSRHRVGTCKGMELTGSLSENACLQLPQLAGPPWNGVQELMSTLGGEKRQKKKPHRRGMVCQTFSIILACEAKPQTHKTVLHWI